MNTPTTTTIAALLGDYDTLLLDAYGVLVDMHGPLPGAVELIERLNRDSHSYLILTNSASRLPETMAHDFSQMGLPIPTDRILSSGMLLESLFTERGLHGATCLVLGPEEAHEYVRRAGGESLSPAEMEDAEVIVIADQKGFDLQQGMDRTLSLLLRRFDQQKHVELLLCNPDLIYPVGSSSYGVTSGALAAMFNQILAQRYPQKPPQFEALGKPHRPIFEAAAKRTGGRMIMVGDQLATDILGAQKFGIDSALVMSGLAREFSLESDIVPC